MAWIAEEQFAYTPGDNWNGASGGLNWTGNWAITDTGDEYDIVSTPAVYTAAAKTANNNGGGTGAARRTFTATASGVVYFLVRITSAAASNGMQIGLMSADEATVYGFYLYASGGNLLLKSGSGDVTLTAMSADTWYELELTYNNAVPQCSARWRVMDGTWSSSTGNKLPWASGSNSPAKVFCDHLGTDANMKCFVGGISASAKSSGTSYTATVTSTANLSNIVAKIRRFNVTIQSSMGMASQVSKTWRAFLTVASAMGVASVKAPVWAAKVTSISGLTLANITVTTKSNRYTVTVQSILNMMNTVGITDSKWAFEGKPSAGTWSYEGATTGTWNFEAGSSDTWDFQNK